MSIARKMLLSLATGLIFALVGAQAHATSVGLQIGGSSDELSFDPVDIFVRLLAGIPPDEDVFLNGVPFKEYDFSGDSGQVTFTAEGSPPTSPLQQRAAVPIALAVGGTDLAFDSILVNIQDNVTLPGGTVTGDAISFSFAGGTDTFEGMVIQQLTINLRDSTATMINGAGLGQLTKVNLSSFTSATFNVLTNTAIANGTVTSYSASLVPIPAALPLFGSVLLSLGFLGLRRTRA